jgi:hypothetical protein
MIKIDDERISLNLIKYINQRNQDKNIKAKSKYTKFAKPNYKQIFIMMKRENVNMKKHNKTMV